MFSALLFAASGRAQPSRIEAGLSRARALGIDVNQPPQSAFSSPGSYLAGDDRTRLASLEQAISGSGDLAWAVRGGYGLTRIAPFSGLSLADKSVLGFSDVTILLAAVHQAGGRAVHGPVLTSLAQADAASVAALFAAVAGESRQWSLQGSCSEFSAPVIGGNLEVLTRLIGTPLSPSFAGHVAVLEDIGEPWYRCDRSLTHLLAATDLAQSKAVVLGTFIDCEEGTSTRLAERLVGLGIPCLTNAPVGHGIVNHAFIWGETTNFSKGTLTLTGACA
jgi:muramoyltetrapeptide carboxypeptidase